MWVFMKKKLMENAMRVIMDILTKLMLQEE